MATRATERTEIHTPLDIVLAHFFVVNADFQQHIISSKGEKEHPDIVFNEIKAWIKGPGASERKSKSKSKERERRAVCLSEG